MITPANTDSITYAGSFVYNNETLSYVLFEEGRLEAFTDAPFAYQYFLKDHLGNTRVTFSANDGLIKQQDHYYPFGMSFSGIANAQAANVANQYKYNGKELQADLDLNWYDYGARFYDPTIGRWHVSDPLAEKYSEISPYAYVANNPMRFIDPDGMFANDFIDKNGDPPTKEEKERVEMDRRQNQIDEEMRIRNGRNFYYDGFYNPDGNDSNANKRSRGNNNGNLHSISIGYSEAMLKMFGIKGKMITIGYIWGNHDASFYLTTADINGVELSGDLSYTEYINLLDRDLLVNDAMGNGGVINAGIPSGLGFIGANFAVSYADNSMTNYEPSSYFAATVGGNVGIPVTASEGNTNSRKITAKDALIAAAIFIATFGLR